MELEKLKAITAAVLGLTPAEISETADFTEVYGADSLEVYRIVTAIEEEFEAEFPEETARCIRSVRDAAKALASL